MDLYQYLIRAHARVQNNNTLDEDQECVIEVVNWLRAVERDGDFAGSPNHAEALEMVIARAEAAIPGGAVTAKPSTLVNVDGRSTQR